MAPVPLIEARDAARFGGKAVELGAALRAGLPVPPGFALSVEDVDQVVAGGAGARLALATAFRELGAPVAARSSAVGEDSEAASFAGQHLTVLNVQSPEALLEAVTTVHASARTDAALAYRAKLGVAGPPQMAVVVQRLIAPECAGVLFTKNPVTGADERVIEGAWGLGEIVVAGLVTPDHYRVSRAGEILERSAGTKDIAIRPVPGGGTVEEPVDEDLVTALCLDDARLGRLNDLAARCEQYFGGSQDLEWGFVGDDLYLLQRRAITARRGS